ncbi:MAG: hypothetical protein KKD74_10520 [Bacteroidetes bacterium]|nr:hypothetical protein [Bacteroidota bacterium]
MKHILLIYGLLAGLSVSAQIGMGTLWPQPSAELELYSLSKGLLVPRIILTADLSDPAPVPAPAAGLMVFNTGANQAQGFYCWTGTQWKLLKSPVAADVSGPASAADNAAVRFDGTSGKLIQSSLIAVSDNGDLTGSNRLTTNQFRLSTNPGTGLQLVTDANGNGSWQGAPPVDIKMNDSLIVQNANALNFNPGIGVYDAGGNEARVTFYTTNVTQNVLQLSTPDSTDINTITPSTIEWKTEHYKDAGSFTHSNTVNPGRIYVRSHAIYEVNFMFCAINKTVKRQTLRTQLRKNGSTVIPHVTSYSFTYQYADNRISHVSSSFLIELAANDYIELITNRQTNDGELRLVPDENVFFIRLMRNL